MMLNNRNTIEIDNIIYELHDNKEAVIVGNKINIIKDINLPDSIIYKQKEYFITEIGPRAFYENRYIDSISFPSIIKKVKESAFEKTSLREVYFEQIVGRHTVELGNACFRNCIRLESVHLPGGLQEIPQFCFENCISLTELNTPWRVTKIGISALYNCHNLRHFDFPPDLCEIGANAFQLTNINYAEISEKVTKVGNLAFADIDKLQTMVISGTNAICGDDFMKNNHQITVYLKGEPDSEKIVQLKGSMSKDNWYVIDNFRYVEELGVFYLLFSKNVARIVGFFDGDIEFDTIIPEKIDGIPVVDWGPGAFKHSKSIESCTFPKSIKWIKGKVFEGCSNLRKVTFNHNIKLEDAVWVIYNDDVEIVINKPE